MSTADFPTMTTAEIRSTFLNFFEERGLKLYPSSSLVPDDPSLLLANAGMNQFKEFYQGKKTMKEIGACSCQKCVRTNDIDCIGEDGRHLSFFEMLGDFSFGGVSKQQACAWAFELITEKFKLPVDRLYFTVFTDDDETHDVWRSLGVAEDHISRLGEDDNFWAAGPTGPCGPCSEIYFDQGPEVGCGKPDCKPGCDCDRFLEFWNLVFTQYDRQEDGSMPELPHRNLDTGMGLERMAAILQHKSANYDGDLMQSLIALGEKISGKKYVADDYSGASRSLRIIADHARAVDFMISDGILPGNEGREYVLRRLLRRAVFHGRLLGIEDAFLTTFIDEVNRLMGEAYPELLKNVALVKGIVSAEEERFSQTLDNGRSYLDAAIAGLAEGTELPGEVAFKLHDTYGFPIDLTVEISEACGHEVDMAAFDACMTEQKERARAAANRDAWGDFNNVWTALSDKLTATDFRGYDEESCEAKVLAIVSEGSEVASAAEGSEVEVVLDATPFYAEMGGQCGDTGAIRCDGATLRVTDTKGKGSLYAHVCVVEQGTLEVGATVTATIDHGRRELIRRNHTATHLMHEALRKVLGSHVEQKGSMVTPEILRFDFSHFQKMTPAELRQVEMLVNRAVRANYPLEENREATKEEAEKCGAMMLFGEKYGDKVRMVRFGTSVELCGGTHTSATGNIGFFKILTESAISAGVRRIEAVTGEQAEKIIYAAEDTMRDISEYLHNPQVLQAVKKMFESNETLSKEVEAMRREQVAQWAEKIISSTPERHGVQLIATQTDRTPEFVKDLAYNLRARSPKLVFVQGSVNDGKPMLTVMLGDEITAQGVNAGAVVREAAKLMQGGGGGQAFFATAGGKNPDGLQAAIDKAVELIMAQVK